MIAGLLDWLADRLRRRPHDALGVFRFHDGTRWRRADPIAVLRRLIGSDGWSDQARDAIAGGGVLSGEAAAHLAAVRDAFDVPSFARGGLTDGGLAVVEAAFFAHLADRVALDPDASAHDVAAAVAGPPSSPPPT